MTQSIHTRLFYLIPWLLLVVSYLYCWKCYPMQKCISQNGSILWYFEISHFWITLAYLNQSGKNYTKAPVTLSRNETEPARINNLQTSSHIWAGMSFLKECRSNTTNSLRTCINWFLHIASVLFLECSCDTVGIFTMLHNVQNALWKPYECSSIAARMKCFMEGASNAVRMQSECSWNGCRNI